MNTKFSTAVSLDLIMPKLVRIISAQPVTAEDLVELKAAHHLKDVFQSTLATVRDAQRLLTSLTESYPAARQALTELAHFPALVVLGNPEEIAGIMQYYQLVNGEIRLTKKNRK